MNIGKQICNNSKNINISTNSIFNNVSNDPPTRIGWKHKHWLSHFNMQMHIDRLSMTCFYTSANNCIDWRQTCFWRLLFGCVFWINWYNLTISCKRFHSRTADVQCLLLFLYNNNWMKIECIQFNVTKENESIAITENLWILVTEQEQERNRTRSKINTKKWNELHACCWGNQQRCIPSAEEA